MPIVSLASMGILSLNCLGMGSVSLASAGPGTVSLARVGMLASLAGQGHR